jgi:hypothetical protein
MSVTTKLKIDNGDLIVQRTQDCEPIIEHNKVLQGIPQASTGTETWGRHVASIPNVIIEQWCVESGVNLFALPQHEFARFIKAKINDPDWRWLRTDR